MARIISTLKATQAKQPSSALPPSEPISSKPETSNPPEVESLAMPFIEVGGQKKMEASPEVLNSHPSSVAHPDILTLPNISRKSSMKEENDAADGPQEEIWEMEFHALPTLETGQGGSQMASELVAYHQPDHPMCQQYRKLLSHLLEEKPDPQLLYVTSLDSSFEVTTTIVNLAILTATEQDKPVIVLDFQNHKRNATNLCGVSSSPPLTDVLAGQVALDEALQKTKVDKLQILKIHNESPKEWQKKRLEWVMTWLRERFAVLFVDFSPLELNSESMEIAQFCDTVVPLIPEEIYQGRGKILLEDLSRHLTHLRGFIHSRRLVYR